MTSLFDHIQVIFDTSLILYNKSEEYRPFYCIDSSLSFSNYWKFQISQGYPKGLRDLLKWIKDSYDSPDIIITENGFSDQGQLNDIERIKYLKVSGNFNYH